MIKLNFTIREGDYEILPEQDLIAFERDYLNAELKSHEVRAKYNLSKKQYSELSQQIREKYGLLRRPYAQSRHFYQQGNRWIIIKTNCKERVYIGSLPADVFSKSDVEGIVEKCKEMAWNIDKCIDLVRVLG